MVSNELASNNVDLGQVESWVRLMHDRSEGYVHVCSTLSWSGAVFDITQDMPKLLSYVKNLDGQGAKGIYLRVSTIGRALAQGERGSVHDSVSLPGFWADIDIAGPGHKTTKPLPPNEAEAQRIIAESGLPAPTLWVHSGGGVYPWWLFAEPIHLVGEEIIDLVQDVSTRWQNVIVATAERLGYSYGGVGDLARVMRVPGTWNRKTDEPKPCAIIGDTGRYYDDDAIAAGLEAAEARVAELAPKTGKQETISIPIQRSGEPTGDRPGDDLANRMSWEEILQPAGYQFDRTQGVETYWVRPGKNRRDGHSCTTNYQGSDLLYVFSTEMDGFENNRTYSKFATWSILNGHGLDLRSASKALRAQGFGAQRPQPARPPQPFQPGPLPEDREPGVQKQPTPIVVEPHYDNSETGNAERMVDTYGDRFRRVDKQNSWYAWNGQTWGVDETHLVTQFYHQLMQQMRDEAGSLTVGNEEHADNAADPDPRKLRRCGCPGCTQSKWVTASRSDAKVRGSISQFGRKAGIAVSVNHFDADPKLITLNNGVLNLEKRELSGFDSRRMLTRQMPVSYDPQATAPHFEAFMEQVLPDPNIREYVQRALGYSLLGENDQRAFFVVHGKSGSGKSQFLNIFEGLFGDFATTAAAAAFRESKNESTYDLHALRGRRFVTTSETSETSTMNEELLKRITGRDNLTTRDLYQSPITWTPEFAIWMATNYAPKMNADDQAIWDRAKFIKFDQQFEGADRVADLGKKILAEEASGILNWLLDGVTAYRQHGLAEPDQVKEVNAAHRSESDTVAQFIAAATEDGLIRQEPEVEVRSSTLYKAYAEWCLREHVPRLGQRRFCNRLKTLGFEQFKNSVMFWRGLSVNGSMGFLGTMG